MNVECRRNEFCLSKKAERSDSTLRNSAVRYSIFDTAESFDPESFSPVLTTEGLVAGCGSLFNPGHPSGPSNHQKNYAILS